jgi:hypothetical protein
MKVGGSHSVLFVLFVLFIVDAIVDNTWGSPSQLTPLNYSFSMLPTLYSGSLQLCPIGCPIECTLVRSRSLLCVLFLDETNDFTQ